jgi:hypothetical protein
LWVKTARQQPRPTFVLFVIFVVKNPLLLPAFDLFDILGHRQILRSQFVDGSPSRATNPPHSLTVSDCNYS